MPSLAHRILGPLMRLLTAAAAGLLLFSAAAPLSWWGAAPVGVALFAASLLGTRARVGALVGAGFGLAFWLPLIHWLTLYLGPVPWLALALFMVLWCALFGAAVAAVWGFLSGRGCDWATMPLAFGALWALREGVQGVWPYGGFNWGTLSELLVDAPVRGALTWFGQAGFGALVATVAAGVGLAAAGCIRKRAATSTGHTTAAKTALRPLAAAAVCLALLTVGALAQPLLLASEQTDRIINVLAVQGNSKSGIFDDRESGQVFTAHERATEQALSSAGETTSAARSSQQGSSVPDVLLWPENAGEFDLPGNSLRMQTVEKLRERSGAPVLVAGTVLQHPYTSVQLAAKEHAGTATASDETGFWFTNSAVALGEGGEQLARVDKRYPVPFAEYMPNRAFFRALAPDLVDLVQLEYQPGRLSPVLQLPTRAGGDYRAGVAICFDITVPEHTRTMVRQGAQVFFALTNNADFGRTAENQQQLQIARVQAITAGRTVVNISTVGTSAIALPTGELTQQIAPYAPGHIRGPVQLATGVTPAISLGSLQSALWQLGAGGLLLAAVARRVDVAASSRLLPRARA